MAEPQVTEEQLKTLHPLAADVVTVFDQTGANPKFVFSDEQLIELSQGLMGLFETQELRDAVRSLLGVAEAFDKQGFNKPARQLFDLLAEKALLDALDRVNKAREAESRDAVAESSEKFKSFQDQTTERSAPKVGDTRPDGTLSIDKLSFPKRL